MSSPFPQKNLLLTGRPRVGKSTLILRAIEKLRQIGVGKIGGFYTIEVPGEKGRTGFDIHTLDGKIAPLARTGLESQYRLGKYGIDMESFESVALSALENAIKSRSIIIVDEIGYMELKSKRFRELVERALDSPSPLLATIMKNCFDFPDRIKARKDVALFNVRVDNREGLVSEIVDRITKLI